MEDTFHSRTKCFSRICAAWCGFVLLLGTAFWVADGVPVKVDESEDTYLRYRSSFEKTIRFLQQNDQNCTETCCMAQDFCASAAAESSWINAVPVPVQYLMVVILLGLSALFSGLTLGVMSLDKTGLEIVMSGDDPVNAAAARKIYPIREDGNLLLCTLVFGNVAVNSLTSIILADKAGGIVGFLSSTLTIVLFGEILPQAACARYALQVGCRSVPIVRVFIILFYPITKPMSFCLNLLLGQELATTYSSGEMRKLLEIHVKEGRFDSETAGVMAGALKYKVDLTSKKQMIQCFELISFFLLASGYHCEGSHDPINSYIHAQC